MICMVPDSSDDVTKRTGLHPKDSLSNSNCECIDETACWCHNYKPFFFVSDTMVKLASVFPLQM